MANPHNTIISIVLIVIPAYLFAIPLIESVQFLPAMVIFSTWGWILGIIFPWRD